ncbi:hypothetical protein CAPTEDRAFT_221993 [Capitella teleta]|uniref:Polybromo-1 n=1 Tax=Capitella teleta TaxID=283909 RepID=R7UQ39_CAPTE|nr:hypothetical protein CAPTEDRAFT_221993 [Capitella teleta]|eukprot:ELU08320.1 hypothetical protein CAPTEDRAFT_221993 [Capitella teleta]
MPPKRRLVSQMDVREEDSSSNSSFPPSKKRRKANLGYDANEVCQELFETIRNHKTEDGRLLCEAFIRLPKRRSEPEYYNMVAQPMDLMKVQSKLKAEEYSDVEELSADIQLIVENSKAFYEAIGDMAEAFPDDEGEEPQKLTEVTMATVAPDRPLNPLDFKAPGVIPPREAILQALSQKVRGNSAKQALLKKEAAATAATTAATAAAAATAVLPSELSMNLRERRYAYREFLPTPKPQRKPEEIVLPKSDDDEESPLEELFTMVAMATENGRCVSDMFKVLPSRGKFPMYFEIIKDPIDLRMIAQRMQSGDYATLDDLVRDLNLMVSNARNFNEPGSQIYRDAGTLRKIISSKHHDIMEQQRSSGGTTPRPIVRSERIRSRKLGNVNKTVWLVQLSAVIASLPDNDGIELGVPDGFVPGDPDEGDDAESGLEGSMFGDDDDPFWQLYKVVRLHKNSLGHAMCEPFLRLPNRRIYPDYYDDIKRPISLLKIQRQIKNERYKDLDQMYVDLKLMFDNAIMYNVEDSQIHKDANTLHELVKAKLAELQQTRDTYWIGTPSASRKRNLETSSTTSEDSSRDVKRGSCKGGKKPLNPEEVLRRRLSLIYKTVYDYTVDLRPLRDIFMTLPSKKDYPDYYKVISEPIDMMAIDAKIKAGMYSSQEALVDDFELMFNNARHYNEEISQVYKDACILERILMAKVNSLPSLDGSKRRRSSASAVPLNTKITAMYNTIRDYKDAKMRVLSAPFMKLPQKTELPDYYEVIKKPIDMNRVWQKISNKHYTSVEELTSDFVLMFDNACKYNEPESLIYKDALTLQRVCLEKKQELCADDDTREVPDVRAAVHDLMTSLFNATFSYTDEEGRSLTDSFLELPSKIEDEVNGGSRMTPCFEQVKSNLDKGRYRRMDRFQEDMFKVFEFARTASSVDSQVYEDSLELQHYFMKMRDELCKNGEVLLTPALSFTESHLQKALEKERKNRTSKERELQKEEDDKRNEAIDKSQNDENSEDSIEYGNDTFVVGDFVYIEPREKGQEPHIVCIEEFDRSAAEDPQLRGCWFLRPNETYHLATRKFLEKEVFKSDFFDVVPLSKVMGKCHVMTVREYYKYKPEGFADKDVFVCESRYSGRHKSFKKIKVWSGGRTGGPSCRVELVTRDQPLTPVRVASVFAGRSADQRTFVDDGQTQVLDKQRQEVAIEAGTGATGDGATYYEQIQTPSSWIKLDDCVLIRVEGDDRPAVVKVEKIWKDISGNAYIHGPYFLHPWQTEHAPTRLFYQREVFRSSVSATHIVSQIIRRCAVLSLKDFCTQRSTEIPEGDVYICESKYKDVEKVIMKFKDSPVKNIRQRSALSIYVCDDEIYFFKKPVIPNKEPSPLLPTTEDCVDAVDSEEIFTNMEASQTESFQATETWTATPGPVETSKKKKLKKGRTVSGYIVYAAECRKDIQNEYMGMSFGEISRIVGSNSSGKKRRYDNSNLKRWKALPREQKEFYEAKARKAMEKYNKELKEAERLSAESGDKASVAPDVNASDVNRTPVLHSTPVSHHVSTPMHHAQGPSRPLQAEKSNRVRLAFACDRRAAASPAPVASPAPPPPAQPPQRPPSPLFVSVPPQPQRVLHSEAYIRYIESLNPQDVHTVGAWERSLYATQDNTNVQAAKLPTQWLANGSGHHESTVAALWALRDLMMKDSLTISRTLDFSQI